MICLLLFPCMVHSYIINDSGKLRHILWMKTTAISSIGRPRTNEGNRECIDLLNGCSKCAPVPYGGSVSVLIIIIFPSRGFLWFGRPMLQILWINGRMDNFFVQLKGFVIFMKSTDHCRGNIKTGIIIIVGQTWDHSSCVQNEVNYPNQSSFAFFYLHSLLFVIVNKTM